MFSSSSKKRLFAIGDIHGCSTELAALLKKIQVREGDTVVFLGDYIDRGPDSRGVIEIIIELARRVNVVALKGNHEAMFLDFLESPESAGAGLFILNGGSQTLASYAGPGKTFEIPETHIKFFYDLKLFYETDTHFFVHAGVPLKALSQISTVIDEQTMLWSRQPFLSTTFTWEKMVVHGHTPVNEPEIKGNRINLDTGCVYNGRLSALELPANKVHSVPRVSKEDAVPILKDPTSDRVAVRFNGALPVRASRPGEPAVDFETLNYNQFGLLMRETKMAPAPIFLKDDEIEGSIGVGDKTISFAGTVVRSESRNDQRLYGVKIDRVTNGDDGRHWIKRSQAG